MDDAKTIVDKDMASLKCMRIDCRGVVNIQIPNPNSKKGNPTIGKCAECQQVYCLETKPLPNAGQGEYHSVLSLVYPIM